MEFEHLQKIILVVWVIGAILGITLLGGLIYVAVHFLQILW